MENSKKRLKKIGKIAVILLIAIGVVLLCIWLFPYVLSLKDDAVRTQFEAWINSLGLWGFFVMIAIPILQVIIAIIPGEPVEILSLIHI